MGVSIRKQLRSVSPPLLHLSLLRRFVIIQRNQTAGSIFTLKQTVEVVCLWSHDATGLSFKFTINSFKINAQTRAITTYTSTQAQTQVTPLKLEPKIHETGSQVIKNSNQQQLLFNSEWSLNF